MKLGKDGERRTSDGNEFHKVAAANLNGFVVEMYFQLEKFCCPIGVLVGNQLGWVELQSTGYAVKIILQSDIEGKKSNG